jgi:hypothetical protein
MNPAGFFVPGQPPAFSGGLEPYDCHFRGEFCQVLFVVGTIRQKPGENHSTFNSGKSKKTTSQK